MKTRNPEELLQKIRKGATAGFNAKDWECALHAIGWQMEGRREETGVHSFRVVAQNGEVFYLAKQPGYRVITFYDFQKWAKAQGLMEAVEAKIGPAPVKKSRQELEANTGTCPCCFGGFKLRNVAGNPGMVLHGYQRPGWGYAVGNCYGVHHLPYELSCSGTRAVLAVAKHREVSLIVAINSLNVGPEELYVSTRAKGERAIKKGDPDYANCLANLVSERQYELRQVRRDIQLFEKKIEEWKPMPLPGTQE
jgi:hypothetical protein